MLNLLPQYQKTKVIREYRLRLAVIILIFLVGAVAALGIFLMPSYVLLVAERKSLETQKASYAHISQGNDAEGEVEAWKSMESLRPFKDALIPTVFMDAMQPNTAGISIEGYSFSQGAPGEAVAVSVNGFAKTREDLSAYAKLLDDRFGGVKLPLSVLAQQANIPFEFKFQATYAKVQEVMQARAQSTIRN